MLRPWMIVVLLLFTITISSASTPVQNTVQCGNLTCAHNAKCSDDGHGGFICRCRTGYMGRTCFEDFDECSRGNPCMHRGRCHNTVGSYRCECLEGWTGDIHCETKDPSTAAQKCMPGWMGEFCFDQCLNDSMCRRTEFCKRLGRGHYCRCAPGWQGTNCMIDVDECTKTPCPNNVTCINTPGSYKCICSSGWKGDRCNKDIDECLMNPCQHSSTCTNEQGYYNCTCAVGWKGDNCDEDINECEQKPCNATITCENSFGSFSCKRMSSDVEEQIYKTLWKYRAQPFKTKGGLVGLKEKSDIRKTKVILFAVLGSVLTVCSMVTCLGILKYKWNVIREVLKGKDASQ